MAEMADKCDGEVVMPVVFIGHGSPMNAIEDNGYSRALTRLGGLLPIPKAILMVSAHWLTKGTWITAMAAPRTIHDFSGFPHELYKIDYPASGDTALAVSIKQALNMPELSLDYHAWGLDHGTWAVLKHVYPLANIPVLQLSIDFNQPEMFHFELGRKLGYLRNNGVIIMASGNIVHNFNYINWDAESIPYDWAIEFDSWVKDMLIKRDYAALVNNARSTHSGKLSIPTLDHYLPLLYILGASDESDQLVFDYEEIQNSSMSMRCFRME